MKPNRQYQNTIFTDNRISNKTLSTLKLSLSKSNRFLNTYDSINSSVVKPILYQSLSTTYNDYPQMSHSHSKKRQLPEIYFKSDESPNTKIHSRHMDNIFDYDNYKELKKLQKNKQKLTQKSIEEPICTDWTNIRIKEIKSKVKLLNKIFDKVFPLILMSKHQLETHYQKKKKIKLKKKSSIDFDSKKQKMNQERNMYIQCRKQYSSNKNILLFQKNKI